MKRFLIISALLILSAGATVPYVTGKFVEGHLQQFENTVMNTDGLQLIGTPHQHQIGWRESQAQSVVKIVPLDGQLSLEQQVSHGFLPLKPVEVTTTLQPDTVLKNTFKDLFGSDLPIEATTQIELNGNSQTFFQQTNGDLKGTLKVNPHQKTVSGTLQAPKLKLPPPTYLFELNGGNYRIDLQRQDERLTTQLSGELESFKFLNQLDVQKIAFHSNTTNSGQMLHQFAWDLKGEQIKVLNKDWGTFNLAIDGKNFDLSGLAKLRELKNAPVFQQRLMLPLMLLQEAPAFLQKLPAFNVKHLSLETADGVFELTGQFEMTPPQSAEINSLNILFKNIQANWDGKISEKLLRYFLGAGGNKNSDEIDKMMGNIENKHRLIKKEGNFVMNLRIENGEALLNGQPLTLRDLKF
ncbi:MAG: hypothetical protein RIT27_2235 [Pseudomonadota bacterium]|jgi:uncharacterized protein YdgA (DUF945 family)